MMRWQSSGQSCINPSMASPLDLLFRHAASGRFRAGRLRLTAQQYDKVCPKDALMDKFCTARAFAPAAILMVSRGRADAVGHQGSSTNRPFDALSQKLRVHVRAL